MTDFADEILAARIGEIREQDADEVSRAELQRLLSASGERGIILTGDVLSVLRGMPFAGDIPAPVWTMDETESVTQQISTYILAGADAALTPTLDCDSVGMAAADLDPDLVPDLCRVAVRATRESSARFVIGAAGRGPSSKLPFDTDGITEVLCELAKRDVHALLVAGVERISDALDVLDRLANAHMDDFGLPIIVSVACDTDKSAMRDGTPFDYAFRRLVEAGASCVCVEGLTALDVEIALAAAQAAQYAGVGLVVRPDAPAASGRLRQAVEAGEKALAAFVSRLIDAGVHAFGTGVGFPPSSTSVIVDELSGRSL